MYREISGIEKFDASEREGVSHFTVENFLSNSIEKFRWGILRCIGKYRVSKNLMHRERGGITYLCRKLSVTQYQKISLGNTSVYQKISDIETFYASERERERGGGDYHVSPSKNCCLTVPIKFVGEHFCVAKDFWYRIFEAKDGEASQFCRNFFL